MPVKDKSIARYVAGLGSLLHNTALAVWLFWKKRVTVKLMVWWLCTGFFMALVWDWVALAGGSYRAFPDLMLVLVTATCFRVDDKIVNGMCVLALVWLLVVRIDSTFRFGLSQVEYHGMNTGKNIVYPPCDCSNPPCALSAGRSFIYFTKEAMFLLVPLGISRYHARLAAEETATIAASIDTARQLATYLALFDLDAAEALLQGHAEKSASYPGRPPHQAPLPPDLRQAFSDILCNLKTYKPYLPRSCLPMPLSPDGAERAFLIPVLPEPVVEPNATLTDDMRASRSGGASKSASRSQQQTAGHLSLSMRDGGDRSLTQSMPSLPTTQRMRTARVTLVQTNLHDAFRLCESSGVGVVERIFNDMVARAVEAFHGHKGMVDHFLGDRIFASFNASRPCARHAVAAVAAAKSFAEFFEAHPGNIAVVSGQAMCGDLGCDQLRRYSILGRLPAFTFRLERIARKLGVTVACNTECQRDACCEHPLRVYPKTVAEAVIPRENDADSDGGGTAGEEAPVTTAPVFLWELVLAGDALRKMTSPIGRRTRGPEEWMYELEGIAKWDTYNEGVKMFLRGTGVDEAVAKCGATGAYALALRKTLEAAHAELKLSRA